MVRSSCNMAPGDLELRGAVANRLRRPGDTIDIDGITYEYCDSSDDESIDEAHQVGPGKTFGIFISRISAPLEMFLGYAAETWLGRRPRAVFNRLFKDVMHRPCPMVGDRCLDPTSAEKLWIDIVNCKDPAQKERNIGSLALLRNYIMMACCQICLLDIEVLQEAVYLLAFDAISSEEYEVRVLGDELVRFETPLVTMSYSDGCYYHPQTAKSLRKQDWPGNWTNDWGAGCVVRGKSFFQR